MAETIEGYTNITDENFQVEVLDSKEIVLVEFYRDDCGSCRIFEPTLVELAKLYAGKFKFLRQNVGKGDYFKKKYNIAGEPTTAIFYDGDLQGSVLGASAMVHFEPQLQAELYRLSQVFNLPPITRK